MKSILKNITPFNNKTNMSNVQFIVKKTLAFWFCYIIGLFIAESLVVIFHFAMGKNIFVGDIFDNQTITLIIYYGYILFIVALLFYWKVVEKKPLSAMGMTKQIGTYFIGVVTAILILLVSVSAIILTGNMEYHGILKNVDIFMIIIFMGSFIVQGAMEELFCRGFLLHVLKEKTSLVVAIGVSTIMFILPHWSSLFEGEAIYGVIGIVNMILISIIFSFLTIYYKNIWVACGLHSFWNAILYSVLGLNLSGNDKINTAIFNVQSVGKNIWNGGTFGIEASVITTIVLIFFVILISILKKSLKSFK